ncbi:MAG: pitrilysin family protein [Desulfobacterales bacterium]|nr:pitrilysin family protein [Desulfobacteraceae bacterium]MDD3990718.1 pitrilysin family protein [Desulfobacteraceae bacterium]MDY0311005.1 pitrilysin family protein [Desulfobacterales bacterium]
MTGDVECIRLPNGIRITTRRMPHVHSIAMGVWVDVGARDEAAADSGLSHMIEHMIFKGTERRSAYQIAKAFDAIGGHTNAFTSLETTCYHAKVVDTHQEAMVDLLGDIFLHSTFSPEEIERERTVILQEIRMVEDSPEELVHTLAGPHLWGDHPLGRSILGPPENLVALDQQRIQAFVHRNYRPERIVIAAAGNLSHDRIRELLAPTFGALPPGETSVSPRQPPVAQAPIRVVERPLEQVHLLLAGPGLSVTDERRYAYSLLNSILGGNMSSRLFQAIREQQGLAYSVYSFVSTFTDSGMIGVYAAVAPENTRETLVRIVTELRRLADTPVGAQRLDDAKAFTKGSLLLAAESNENQMMRLAQNEIYLGRFIPMAEVTERIDAVSASEIQDLAGVLLDPHRLSLTAVGPVPSGAVEAAGWRPDRSGR